ncbi:hypothetical protein V9T40_010655 [Parthenolecanium corni]|uniref:Uncharacterized protein n=1 Tax=Parthenolecanium corni TaxID=536013 RepID=A0AAN9XXU9_9HEMI
MSTEELKNMILQFKVPDLQSLLGFAGQNKNGRKNELQKKALTLIQCRKSVPLEMKVRHIYRNLVVENSAHENRTEYFSSGLDKYNNYYIPNGYSNSAVSNGGYNSYNTRNGYHNSTDSYYNAWSRPTNGYATTNHNPPSNLRSSPKFDYASYLESNTRIPVADDLKNVVFKKLSFFKFKSCIYPLTPLIPRNQHSELFEFTLPFTLAQQEHSLINWAKKSGKESRYQVQLRICLLDNSVDFSGPYEVGDSLPLALGVKLNDKNCQLPPAIPSTNKQGMLLKRMNFPINLTPQTRRNHANNLVINWSIECNKVYGFTIHLVEKYTSEELIEELVKKGERDAVITKAYLNEKLSGLGDDDIAATSLKVSLLCPLGKILMTLPVKATTCNHLQCFDGALYLKMNEVKSTWQCPVCNKCCFYEDLFIDGYFANILRQGNFGSDVSEIQIEADGSIVPVVPKKRTTSAPEESSRQKRPKLDEQPCKADWRSVKNRDPSPEDDRVSPPGTRTAFSAVASLPSYIPLCSPYSSFAERAFRSDFNEQTSSSSSTSDERSKKNVVLVDLTETDSETEDAPSASPPSPHSPENSSPTSPDSESSSKESPPIYDIDDSDPS